MYRKGKEYNKMCNLAMDIYEDYGITKYSFPLDMKLLLKRMGISLVPYSLYPKHIKLLLKTSIDAFCVPSDGIFQPVAAFNDIDSDYPQSKINSNIGHEIKHIANGDINDDKDDLADYFSKYFRCPVPYVIYLEIDTEEELMEKFGISYEQATYVMNNVKNRINKYGRRYFVYELRLFKQLLGGQFDENDFELIDPPKGGGAL